MSKVQLIQPNYQQQQGVGGKNSTNYAAKQGFGAKTWDDLSYSSRKLIKDEVKNEIDKKQGWLGKKLEDLGKSKGEAQTQAINAVFTSTLAPWVIYKNPYSEKSKEDRAYLAWRQPISAVIALGVCLPITIGSNNYLNKMYNEGYVNSLDLRAEPNDAYLLRKFKKEHKIIKPSLFFNGKEKDLLKADSKKFKADRMRTFRRLLSRDPGEDNSYFTIDENKTIWYKNGNGKPTEIGKNIPNLDTKEKLKKYLKDNNFYNRTLGDFLEDEFKFEYNYSDNDIGLKTNVAEERLSKTLAMDFLRTIGLIEDEKEKVNEDRFKKTILEYRQEKHAPEYAELEYGKEENYSKEDWDKIIEKTKKKLGLIGQDASRNIQMSTGEEAGKKETLSLNQFFHQIGYKLKLSDDDIEVAKKAKTEAQKNVCYKSLQNLSWMKMSDVLRKFRDDVFIKENLEGFNKKAGNAEFAQNMLKHAAKRNTSYAGNHLFWMGIGVSLATTVVACSILNWVYPRFMDKYFPNLSQNNKKGGLNNDLHK